MQSIVTIHVLRATFVTLLIESKYDDSTITLRTCYKDVKSGISYHDLMNAIWFEQMGHTFDKKNPPRIDKSQKDEDVLFDDASGVDRSSSSSGVVEFCGAARLNHHPKAVLYEYISVIGSNAQYTRH